MPARLRAPLRLTPAGAGVLVLAAALLVVGGLARYPGVLGLGAALLLLVVVALGQVLLPLALGIERRISPVRVPRLGDCTGHLEVTGRGRRRTPAARAHDQVAGVPVPLDLPELAPGETAGITFAVPAEHRGEVAVGPLTVRRAGLAELATRTVRHGGTTTVLVLPRLLDCHGLPSGVRRGHVGADERVERGGTDLVGLREYLPGDDLRRLHWATSARTGTLMVREDADPSHARLTVLLDLRADSYDPTSGLPGDQEAADAAVSLVAAAARGGHPARLVLLGAGTELTLAPGGAGTLTARLAPVLDAVARTPLLPAGAVAEPVALHEPDVLAVVTGAGADVPGLALHLGRAAAGAVLVVDPRPERAVSTLGPAVVCRGPRAEDLLSAWDEWVAR